MKKVQAHFLAFVLALAQRCQKIVLGNCLLNILILY